MYVATLKTLSNRTSLKLWTCAGLVTLADVLFYDHKAGWVYGLFGLVLLVASLMHNSTLLSSRIGNIAACAAAGLTLAMVETPGTLTLWLYIITIVALALFSRLRHVEDVRQLARAVLRYTISGWFRLAGDIRLHCRLTIRNAMIGIFPYVLNLKAREVPCSSIPAHIKRRSSRLRRASGRPALVAIVEYYVHRVRGPCAFNGRTIKNERGIVVSLLKRGSEVPVAPASERMTRQRQQHAEQRQCNRKSSSEETIVSDYKKEIGIDLSFHASRLEQWQTIWDNAQQRFSEFIQP